MFRNSMKRTALTLIEVLVIIIVIVGILLALLLPALEAVRQAAMRFDCNCQLRNIGIGLHNYAQANKGFPPGCIFGTGPEAPSYPVDVWAAAGAKGVSGHANSHGTSWILSILPYMEMGFDHLFTDWDFTTNVAGNALSKPTTGGKSNHQGAMYEIKVLYCPTHRSQFRKGIDDAMCLRTDGTWTGGGTDYGGCAGRVYGWATDTANHTIQDPDSTTLLPPYTIPLSSAAGKAFGVTARKSELASSTGLTTAPLSRRLQTARPTRS